MVEYDISDITDVKDRELFLDMLSYTSDNIDSYQINENNILVKLIDGAGEQKETIQTKLDFLKKLIRDTLLTDQEKAKTKVIFDRTSKQPTNTGNIYEHLLAKKEIIEMDKGIVAFTGIYLKVFNYFLNKV
jgi:hypothetical protein